MNFGMEPVLNLHLSISIWICLINNIHNKVSLNKNLLKLRKVEIKGLIYFSRKIDLPKKTVYYIMIIQLTAKMDKLYINK